MRSGWLGRRDAIARDSWRVPWARGRRSSESRVVRSPSRGSGASWKGAEGSAGRSELKAKLGGRRDERSGAEEPRPFELRGVLFASEGELTKKELVASSVPNRGGVCRRRNTADREVTGEAGLGQRSGAARSNAAEREVTDRSRLGGLTG
ncbi:hypothetical protein CDL15_Pgr011057 [Punica granatum]|uniref:Uncharacterized protein n=1 Tax=Punica granatum TaxID=22663 RepID=A0A218XMQ9_PUNGR|nr:hypothetical protein CDL15_Pgr011057 [Punica granatum]